jgi:hypothetical protein
MAGTLVKAGLRPPPPAAIGLDKGPAIDKSRCREIEGQERAASLTPVRPTTKRDAKPLFAKEKMIAQVRSAIRLRDSGKGKRLTRLTGEQNQKERTFDVLPKPANLISYRQSLVSVREQIESFESVSDPLLNSLNPLPFSPPFPEFGGMLGCGPVRTDAAMTAGICATRAI